MAELKTADVGITDVMTLSDAAKEVGLSYPAIHNAVKAKKLKVAATFGNTQVVSRQEVERFKKEREERLNRGERQKIKHDADYYGVTVDELTQKRRERLARED